jgi:hypothetical protein
MTNPDAPLPGRSVDDEPAVPEAHDELPDHLDLPLEVDEADALDQEREVELDDPDE